MANSHTESCAEHHDVKSWGVDQVIAFFERFKFPPRACRRARWKASRLSNSTKIQTQRVSSRPDGLGFNKLMFKGRLQKEMEKLVSKYQCSCSVNVSK